MARKTGLDASEHLGILHHVIHSPSMNIPAHMKDEALSEGLVILTDAALRFDPSRGVPPHYWLAKKLRWSLTNWLTSERRRHGLNDSYNVPCENHAAEWHDAGEDIPALIDMQEQHEMHEILAICKERLPEHIFIALFGNEYGMQMKELSRRLRANPKQIKAMQSEGHEIINELRLL